MNSEAVKNIIDQLASLIEDKEDHGRAAGRNLLLKKILLRIDYAADKITLEFADPTALGVASPLEKPMIAASNEFADSPARSESSASAKNGETANRNHSGLVKKKKSAPVKKGSATNPLQVLPHRATPCQQFVFQKCLVSAPV